MTSPGNDSDEGASQLDRDFAIAAIVHVLEDETPRTAKEIVAAIRVIRGLSEVTRRDVNSVLYGELASRVFRNEGFKWSLTRFRTPKSELASSAVNRASCLRAIHRLRSGTPPSENMSALTVGVDGAHAALARWVSASTKSSRWLLVSGDYGEGKTHTLNLIRDAAQSLGFATSHLTADAWSSALNHPQRFLPLLLGTLELPNGITGYEELLYRALSESESLARARVVVDRVLCTGRTADIEATLAVSRILRLSGSAYGSEEHLRAIRDAIYHLTGDSTRNRASTAATRLGVYALLKVALSLVKHQEAQGLVVLLDEVESVFTKLPTVRSRFGAYRVMASLCEALDFMDMKVVLAVTPDAEKWLRMELGANAEHIGTTSAEPIKTWSDSLRARQADIRCRGLRSDQRAELATKIKTMYQFTYPAVELSQDLWESFLTDIESREVAVRALVREIVDFLDAQRYGPREVGPGGATHKDMLVSENV